MPRLVLSLLGQMVVTHQGQPVPGLVGTKAGLLLAYLASERHKPHPRELIATLLWPDLPHAAARANLRQAILQLHRRLPVRQNQPAFIRVNNTYVGFGDARNVDLDIDAVATAVTLDPGQPKSDGGVPPLHRIQGALERYRGPFLDGIDVSDLPEPLAQWLEARRQQYRQHALTLLERLCDHLQRQGAIDLAISFAQRYLESEPLDEHAHRIVIRLLAASGRPEAALQQYDCCRRLLHADLGASPAPETEVLHQEILADRDDVESGAPSPALEPEQRLVTVLAVTFAAESVDLEARAQTVHRATTISADIIRQYRGHVVQAHGGVLLAYFGYPAAREHAAHDAARSALAVACNPYPGVETRIGLHTGLMVTGTEPELPDPCGDLSERALMTARQARPYQPAVSEALQPALDGYFTLEPLSGTGLHALVADCGPVDRVDAWPAHRLTPLVGRAQELGRLRDAWHRAVEGTASAVLLVGEPGIGKTRLAAALRDAVDENGASVLKCRGTPEGQRHRLMPVIRALNELLETGTAWGAATTGRTLLDGFLTPYYPALPSLAESLLARLLGIESAGEPLPPRDPVQERDELIDVLVNLFKAMAERNPLLLIVEDLHWADSTTLELLRRLMHRVHDQPLLLVATTRPLPSSPWPVKTPIEVIELEALADTDSRVLMGALAQDRILAAEQCDWIVRNAQGNPLFLEQLTHHYLTHHEERDDARAVPPTLQELLSARLEQLGDAREVAQLAATFGDEFDAAWLTALASDDREALRKALHSLVNAGFLVEVPDTDPPRYAFRHMLLRRVAYESRLPSQRRAAHKRVAETLIRHYPDAARNQPELVAHHLAAAGEPQQAVAYQLRAGSRALAQAAHREAVLHFEEARKTLQESPAAADDGSLALDAQLGLGLGSLALHGYGSRAVHDTFTQALALSDPQRDPDRHFLILWGLWHCASSDAGFDRAHRLAEEMAALAERCDDRHKRIAAHYAQGNTCFSTGHLHRALQHLQQARRLYSPDDHPVLATTYGDNPALASGAFEAWTLWFMGHPDAASRCMDELVAAADRTHHAPTRAYIHTCEAMLAFFRNEPERAREAGERVDIIAHEHNYPLWRCAGQAIRGWTLARAGSPEGRSTIEETVAEMGQVMPGVTILFLLLLLDATEWSDDPERALAVADEALACIDRTGFEGVRPEIRRRRAELLLRLARDTEVASRELQAAVDTARASGAAMLELQALTTQRQYLGDNQAIRERLATLLNRESDQILT